MSDFSFWWTDHNRRDSHMSSVKCHVWWSTQQEEQQVAALQLVTFFAGVDVLRIPHPPAQVFNAEVFGLHLCLMVVKKKKKKTSPVSTRRSWRRGETAFWTSGKRFQRGSGPMAAVSQAYPSEEALLPDALSNHGGSGEKLSPSAVNRLLIELVMYFGRALLVLYPVYLSGYLGFSVSWVLLCMVMITWWKKNRQYKDTRIGTAIEFVDNESQVVHQELRSALQMASWVCTILGGVNRWSLVALLQGTRAAQGFRFRGKDVKPVSCLIIRIADISAAMKTRASLTPCYHDYNWVASRD